MYFFVCKYIKPCKTMALKICHRLRPGNSKPNDPVDNSVVNPLFKSTISIGDFNNQTKFKRNLYFSFMRQQIEINLRAGKAVLKNMGNH